MESAFYSKLIINNVKLYLYLKLAPNDVISAG